MKEHLVQINSTISVLNLSMTYSPISMWKWQMQSQMDQSLAMQESMGGVEGERENFKVQKNIYFWKPTLFSITEDAYRNKPVFTCTHFCGFCFTQCI